MANGRRSSPSRAIVLVVQSDPDARDTICAACEQANYSSVAVATLADARRALREREVACLILGLRLPDGPGEQLLGELASRRRAPPTIVIASSRTDHNTAKSYGVVKIESPLDKDVLQASIEVAVKQDTRPVALK